MLKKILTIKEIREAEAQRGVSRARQALSEATDEETRARDALTAHVDDCTERELALYRALMTRQVSLREIDEVTQKVDGFKASIREHRVTLDEASTEVEASEARLVTSREHHTHALRARQKFTEAVDQARIVGQVEAQAREDLEMEEARLPSKAES